MTTPAARAYRLASALGVLKWALIAGQLVLALAVIYGISQAHTWPEWTLLLEPVVGVVALFGMVLTWLVLGWLQHVLRMLVELVQGSTGGSGA